MSNIFEWTKERRYWKFTAGTRSRLMVPAGALDVHSGGQWDPGSTGPGQVPDRTNGSSPPCPSCLRTRLLRPQCSLPGGRRGPGCPPVGGLLRGLCGRKAGCWGGVIDPLSLNLICIYLHWNSDQSTRPLCLNLGLLCQSPLVSERFRFLGCCF